MAPVGGAKDYTKSVPNKNLEAILNRVIFPIVVDGVIFRKEDVLGKPRWWWLSSSRDAWRKIRARLVVLEHLVDVGSISVSYAGFSIDLYLETGSESFLIIARQRTSEGIQAQMLPRERRIVAEYSLGVATKRPNIAIRSDGPT